MNLTDISPFNYYSAPSTPHPSPLTPLLPPNPLPPISKEIAIFVDYDRKEIQFVEQDSRGCSFRGIRLHISLHDRTHRLLLGLRRVHRIIV